VAIAGASCSLGAFLTPTLPTCYLLIGDSTWDVLNKIVAIMDANGRDERLYWDLYNIPHHCSYLALGRHKGAGRTVPVPNVQWLLDQCQTGGVTVASSNAIPTGDTNDPPHRQMTDTHRKTIRDNAGHKFEVTMEHPNQSKPKPIEREIESRGVKLRKLGLLGTTDLMQTRAPRAG
jgi:hypothetical protein